MGERIQVSGIDNVQVGEVVAGLLSGDVELLDLPESFKADGRYFPITTDTIAEGLRMQLTGRRSRELKHAIAIAEADEATYRGIEVRSPNGNNDNVFIKKRSGESILVQPSVLEPGQFESLLQSATPESVEDFALYVSDILNNFTRGLIVSNDFKAGGWDDREWSYVAEVRSEQAEDMVKKVTQMRREQHQLLGGDFSVNLSTRHIAEQFFDEMNQSGDPELFARQFASTWLELRFQQEIALRLRADRRYPQSETRHYGPGSLLSAAGMTKPQNRDFIENPREAERHNPFLR